MIRALVIANSREAAELIGKLAARSGNVTIERMFCPAPGIPELAHVLNTLPLDVAVFDSSLVESSTHLLELIRDKSASLPVVGFNLADSHPAFPEPFELRPPFSADVFEETIRHAIRHRAGVQKNVFAILPAKAGSGATTIALNTAAQLAAWCEKRVAVADADLRSGIIADSLELRSQLPIEETLRLAESADSLIWPRHVAQKCGIHFLPTRRQVKRRPSWIEYHHLLGFLGRRYDSVIVDLPEVLEDANLEVVQAATRVFVATTPEFLSLILARQRVKELESAGVERDRIRIVLNRWHSRDLKANDVSTLLGCTVDAVFPNDYSAVSEALEARGFVDPRSRLGSSYRAFASVLAGGESPRIGPAKASLLSSLRWSLASAR